MSEEPTQPERGRGEMPFLDHLEELRWRLIKSLIAVVVGIGGGYALVTHIDVIAFLKHPIEKYLPAGQKLLFTSLMDPFLIQLKLAIAIGCVAALPVILYQVWAFLRPALYQREAKIVIPMAFSGIVLFVIGSALGFYVVMPLAIPVLLSFSTASLQPLLTATEYFSLTLSIVLVFGAVFEVPLVMFLLIYMRLVSSSFLKKHHRTFIMVNAVASALLTPGDLVVMTLIAMIPIQLFYELAIVMAIVMEKRRAKAERLAEQQSAQEDSDSVPAAGPA
ncbi:MAG TPA: twin-arginine translocase subunit TatC [Gemmatimonadales bacterium]|jgi:sec-independent protein translocase protein TatC